MESPQQPTRKQDRLQPPDFTAAVARIEKGEKIAAVADDIGAPFAGLRAAWANHCRQKKAAERKTAPALSRPTLPAPAKVECVLCSREFTPSESSPDKCARCAGEFQ